MRFPRLRAGGASSQNRCRPPPRAPCSLSMPGKGSGCAPSCCSTAISKSNLMWSTLAMISCMVAVAASGPAPRQVSQPPSSLHPALRRALLLARRRHRPARDAGTARARVPAPIQTQPMESPTAPSALPSRWPNALLFGSVIRKNV